MNHREVIMMLGGYGAVARMLELPERRVRAWRDRESIPPRYWPVLVKATSEVDLEDLVMGCPDVMG